MKNVHIFRNLFSDWAFIFMLVLELSISQLISQLNHLTPLELASTCHIIMNCKKNRVNDLIMGLLSLVYCHHFIAVGLAIFHININLLCFYFFLVFHLFLPAMVKVLLCMYTNYPTNYPNNTLQWSCSTFPKL